jgi:hypothetical protein
VVEQKRQEEKEMMRANMLANKHRSIKLVKVCFSALKEKYLERQMQDSAKLA